ncbi:MAG: M1 family metallopeptidase [Chloroflexi bacterium]|nr:M1 family metallopeptidase [Chloroflexota bacterium]
MQPTVRSFGGSAIALLAVLVVLATAPTRASAQSEDAADSETVTTTLHPGWNMVGWLGPDAPASELFEAIPALQRVSAWDPVHQRYLSRTRTTIPRHALRDLRPGMGLWLKLGGDEPFEWTRPVVAGGVLVSLRAGRNLVGWAGTDGTAIEEALRRFGGSLLAVSQWDADSQGYDHYRPDAGHSRNTLVELERGDGLWVELTADARWWQSEAAGVEFTFSDSVPAERHALVQNDMASVVTFYAERYGIKPPEFSVTVDFDLDIFAGVRAREILISQAALDYAYLGATLAHEYFHILQGRLGDYPAIDPSPRWMTEGAATYAGGLYERERWGTPAESLRLSRLRHSLAISEQLDDLTLSRLFYRGAGPVYSLAALALEWLSGYAAADSPDTFDPTGPGWSNQLPDHATYVDYYAALASADDWREAFEATFGLSPDDFYESFESYRSALTLSRFPHLGDNEERPLLVLVGDTPTETEAAIRARFATMLELFATRLAAGSADYAIYIGADADSLADIYLAWAGTEVPEDFCSEAKQGVFLIATVDCLESSPRVLSGQHTYSVRARLAPWESLEPVEYPYDRRGPMWLLLGIDAYADHVYADASGQQPLDSMRNQERSRARLLAEPLDTLAGWDQVIAADFWRARSLSFIAGDLLAELAGEPALFDYFRQLPSSASWQEGFETAFGMSVDDFYEAFEAHRAEVAPPFPHLADDGHGPVLVFVGDVSAEQEAAISTRFAGIRALFSERLQAGAADYTLYVGTDPASLAQVHVLTTGHDLPQDFCNASRTGVYLIATVDCIESRPRRLQQHHSHSIRAHLAPSGSLPPAERGHDRRGPLWLLLAIEAYADNLAESALSPRTLDEIRAGQVTLAKRVVPALSTLTGSAEVNAVGFWNARALSSIAGELLAERAGEAALFDYFRRLPDADTWQEAFETAFGMNIEVFFEQFEAHRAGVTPPADGGE